MDKPFLLRQVAVALYEIGVPGMMYALGRSYPMHYADPDNQHNNVFEMQLRIGTPYVEAVRRMRDIAQCDWCKGLQENGRIMLCFSLPVEPAELTAALRDYPKHDEQLEKKEMDRWLDEEEDED